MDALDPSGQKIGRSLQPELLHLLGAKGRNAHLRHPQRKRGHLLDFGELARPLVDLPVIPVERKSVYGDHITSWSTHVTLGASLCNPTGPYGYKQVGGVGDGLVRLRAGGYFACPTTVPWITYHYNRWFDTSFYTRGSAAVVATS